MRIAPVNILLLAVLATGVAGGLVAIPALQLGAFALLMTALLVQVPRLLPLARLLLGLGVLAGLGVVLLLPEGAAAMRRSAVQGTGFAALLTVLGMLRHPVRHSPTVRGAMDHLAGYPARHRFAAVNVGAHFLSLLFSVGVVSMLVDLLRRPGAGVIAEPGDRALLVAAMRGMAMVAIWSPLGLGLAIVTAAIPRLDPLAFLLLALGFTAVPLLVTSRFPLLPAEAAVGTGAGAPPSPVRPLLVMLGVSGVLLGLAIGLHALLDISFTLATIAILPPFAALWLRVEPAEGFARDIVETVNGLADMRNECTIFLSANLIGTAVALLAGHTPLALILGGDGPMALPILLGLLIAIPLAAACYLPSSIVIVIAAQMLGNSPLGQAHPLALGIVLVVGWATSIIVSPISAMSLLVGMATGAGARRVAGGWNLGFVCLLTVLGALMASAVFMLT